MFSEDQLKAYKSITAPDKLYQKVVKSSQKSKPLYLIPLVASLAASIAIIFGVSAFWFGNTPDIIINGSELDSAVKFYDVSPASELDARVTPVLSVPVEIELQDESEITVSYGVILSEGNSPDNKITANESVDLLWELSKTDPFPECKMTINTNGKETEIVLTYNQADNSYTATKN